MESNAIDSVPSLVKQLYGIVAELERLFPGRHFTPDGHLVGSLGEVIAAHRYGLTLCPGSTPIHDAQAPNGVPVQVKTTQVKSVALRAKPRHLIVLFLGPDGQATEIFNGPGAAVWAACGRRQQNGQRSIGISKLKALMADVLPSEHLEASSGIRN